MPSRFGRFVSVESEPVPLGETEGTGVAADSALARLGSELRRGLLGPPLTQHARSRVSACASLSRCRSFRRTPSPRSHTALRRCSRSSCSAAGGGLGHSLPIAATIAFLMLAVGISYRQTIRAYPHGGGSYIVASDNLGRMPGAVAAAGLTDRLHPDGGGIGGLGPGRDHLGDPCPLLRYRPDRLAVIALLLAGNLRGVREAGALFAAPTYVFILAIGVLVAVGLIDAAGRGFHATARPPLHATEGVGLLLVLRAFASGSTAMTGIEAISNAVPVFKPVEWRNARTTLTWMVGLLIVMFAGTIAIVQLGGIVPSSHETVLSELAHRSFGLGLHVSR